MFPWAYKASKHTGTAQTQKTHTLTHIHEKSAHRVLGLIK